MYLYGFIETNPMMADLTLRAAAKVNLALDVLRRDEGTGYHEIQTVYQEIPLYDEITLSELSEDRIFLEWRPLHHNLMNQDMGTSLFINPNEFLLDSAAFAEPPLRQNFAFRAAKLIKDTFHIQKGVYIKIKKNIPLRSGLGGGSSNAAEVLKGLNTMWKLGLSSDQLRSIGSHIGMDVAFFIEGGTALGTHFGECIEILPPLDMRIVLYHTGIEVESRSAYRDLSDEHCGLQREKTHELVQKLRKGGGCDLPEMTRLLHNDFETLIFQRFPQLTHVRKSLQRQGFAYSGLSGSGGVMYAVF